MRSVTTLLLGISLALTQAGCGGSGEVPEKEFQSGMQKAIDAAEKGKELMKDATPKRR